MTYVHTASQANDVPCENGQLSEALKLRLTEEDLLDIATLLRYRGVRTLRALESLETNERAVLLCKARDLCALYGIFPSNLKKGFGQSIWERVLRNQPRGLYLAITAWVCWRHGVRHASLCSCLRVSAVGGWRRL